MECHTLINSLGLIINIIGSLILLKFGLPNRISPEGHISLILEGVDQDEINKAKIYKRWSFIGIIFLIVGFVFQLASNFITM